MVECLSSPFIRLKSPSASFPNIYSWLATPKQFSTSESLVLTIRKLSFCDFFPRTMQSAFDLLTPLTLYTIIKSNSAKRLERRTAVFYPALGEKTPRRCIAADIAMRKRGVAQAQTKCPSALMLYFERYKPTLNKRLILHWVSAA